MNKRVECDQCSNFIYPVHENEDDLLAKVIIKAKCKLGKRVMFRQPRHVHDDYGYFRYCNDFE